MKRAIIMGASSGIGHETAKLLIAQGWHIGVAARRIEMLEELKMLSPETVETAQIDVCHDDADKQLLALAERIGGMDIYIHASGVGKQNTDLKYSIEQTTVNTNVAGFIRLVDCAFSYMEKQRNGHIVVISSIAGTKGMGAAPSYSASKAFQNTYIQALEQLSNGCKLNIRFTDIRPGFVDTPLLTGDKYPMLMSVNKVAKSIVNAIKQKKHIAIIDYRYRILTTFWKAIPNCLWRNMRYW